MAGPRASPLRTKSSNVASAKRRVGVTFPTFSALTSRRQASVAARATGAATSMRVARLRRMVPRSPLERLIGRGATGAGQDVVGDGRGDVHRGRVLEPVPARDPVDLDHEPAP